MDFCAWPDFLEFCQKGTATGTIHVKYIFWFDYVKIVEVSQKGTANNNILHWGHINIITSQITGI